MTIYSDRQDERIFKYRKQEVLQGRLLVADFKSTWPAVFTETEVHVLYVFRFYVCPQSAHTQEQEDNDKSNIIVLTSFFLSSLILI